MTRTILDFYKSVEIVTTQLVRMIVTIFSFSIGELAPLAAPLAPSFSIYLAMSQRLHMPQLVALVAAGTIEIVGMYSAKISVRCYRWNTGRNKSEPVVPQALSFAMTGIFYIVVLALALTIELLPSLTALIFPAFTLISVSVYVNMAIDQNLRKLETDKAAELEMRHEKNGLAAEIRTAQKALGGLKNEISTLTAKAEKLRFERDSLAANIEVETAKLARLSRANDTESNPILRQTKTERKEFLNRANETRKLKKSERQAALIELADDHTQPEIAEILDVSISTVKRDFKELNGSVKKEAAR